LIWPHFGRFFSRTHPVTLDPIKRLLLLIAIGLERIKKILPAIGLRAGRPEEFVKKRQKCSPTHFLYKNNSVRFPRKKVAKNLSYSVCNFPTTALVKQTPIRRKVARSGHPG
jgi:hypothetical protein